MNIDLLSGKLKALAHPVRLKIATLLALESEDMYLNQIANKLEINLSLIHI